MSKCPSSERCPFFLNNKMTDLNGVTRLYKRRYCDGDNSECARWKIGSTIGKQYVPSDLYPNELSRALEILDAHNKK